RESANQGHDGGASAFGAGEVFRGTKSKAPPRSTGRRALPPVLRFVIPRQRFVHGSQPIIDADSGHAGKLFWGEMHGCLSRRRGRAPNPASWPFRALHAPKAPPSTPLSVTPLPRGISWSSRSFNGTHSASAGRYRRRPRGQFRGKMPELMSMRPRAFRLPGDSIDRARFSAGRAGPFHEGNGRRTLKMPDEPI